MNGVAFSLIQAVLYVFENNGSAWVGNPSVAVSRYQQSPRHSHVRKECRIVAERGEAALDIDPHTPVIFCLALVPGARPGRLGLACAMIAVTNSRMVANSAGGTHATKAARLTHARGGRVGYDGAA
ncbi:hypothetical protein QCM80_18270 [Bradyrhizobium sp. SSUT112]|uniref:hypothetical protein n=1 Tax=Bradyrhizobium sp. SSUT112 TaxID=3040604 RepID=UPI00244C6E9E|nr:hypothetical protein [Bradyrhizobium sp. SSUT112]MDH2352582.1 hypothetical protein [Bradyrhizobium sp. SSUT112]